MEKIKKITLNDDKIKMELDNHELSIPLDQDYVKRYIDNALLETKKYLKDFKFYKFGSNICKIAIILSAGMYFGCILSDFILLDLMVFLCGGLGGVSLLALPIFKSLEKKSLTQAYNNDYWLKIEENALNNIKKSKDKKNVSTKTNNNKKSQIKTHNFYNNLTEENEIVKSSRKL